MSHIIWHINPKFNLWIYIGVMECHSLFSATVTLISGVRPWKNAPTADRLYYLWMVAVPYLVCRYILGPGESPTVSSLLCLWPLVLVLARSSPEHICIQFEVGIPNLVWIYILWSWHAAYTSGSLWHVTCTLTCLKYCSFSFITLLIMSENARSGTVEVIHVVTLFRVDRWFFYKMIQNDHWF